MKIGEAIIFQELLVQDVAEFLGIDPYWRHVEGEERAITRTAMNTNL